MIISFTEAAKLNPKLTPAPSLGPNPNNAAPKIANTKKEPEPVPTKAVAPQELPEPSAEDDISDDNFEDEIGGFDPNNPSGIPQVPVIPITVATEYISQLKDIKVNLDRLSAISFNLSIDINKDSLTRKNFIESQIVEVNLLYDIMAAGVKEIMPKLPELIKMFHDIIDNIYQELKKLNLEYGIVKTKMKSGKKQNQKTDSKKDKKDK